MRHEKYGALVTSQELILFDILTELKALNEKLTPDTAPAPVQEQEAIEDVDNRRTKRKRTV